MLELIRTYFAYQHWANQRVLDAAGRLSAEQLTNIDLVRIFPIRDTFVHIMWGQQVWLERWRALPQSPQFDPNDFPDLASIRTRWRRLDRDTDRFLEELTEERLLAPITYTDQRGNTWTYPLWKPMLHQANHATYHRGEIAALLTRLDVPPGELDVLRMFDGYQPS